MIQIKNGQLQVGQRMLFDDLTLALQADAKVGLVGRNGAGKSTLLKIIAGHQQLTGGALQLDKKKKIAYMPQEVVISSPRTVFQEVCTIFQSFLDQETRMRELETRLEAGDEHAGGAVEEYVELQRSLAQFDKHRALIKATQLLEGLGFDAAKREQLVSNLSVGWKMRVLLAQLLLMEADFYLFDEPTNHLDIVAKEWFLSFLKNGNFGYLLVTHDRYYLEHACPLMLELSNAKATLFHGNLSYYLARKQEQRASALATRARQEKEMAKKQETIDAFRYTPSKAKMVQSMIKQLERIELVDVEPEMATVSMKFPPAIQPGKVVLTLANVTHRFDGKTLFAHVNLEVARGEKVALIAANGVGKTTLFKLIQGALPLEKGSITFGHQVKPVFFEQDQSRVLTASNTVLQEVQQAVPKVPDSLIRSMLGSFLFTGDDVLKKIEVLSGGERNRVAMVKVLLQQGNFLLLDEPTNHLDMYAQDVLLQALRQFEGTILMVCHDHDFIQKLATVILELTPQGINRYNGDYESYLYVKKHQQEAAQSSSGVPEKKPLAQEADADNARQRRKEITALESRIAKLEVDIRKRGESFATLTYGTLEYRQAEKKYKELQHELEQKLAEWEKMTV